jgi:signal transduction histidine kinase
MLWLARQQETDLLVLALVGLAWVVRDLHFHVTRPPFDPFWFAAISRESIYVVVPLTFVYCLDFARMPNVRRWQMTIAAVAVCNMVLRLLLLANGYYPMLASAMLLVMGLAMVAVLLVTARQRDGLEQWLIFGVVVLNLGFAVHDLGRVFEVRWWDGLGFFMQPFAGLSLFSVFFISMGRRYVAALAVTESLNQRLEQGIATARADLAESENRRRALEVTRALESERERLMREMHDGIGANLVAAVAVAEHQGQPASTIATLRRALADLKLTVDSLEPVEGDLVLLLASLRHRIAGDMAAAGLAVEWQVAACPPLNWLDATNALHLLRLFQEAISNAIQHSSATCISIGCAAHDRAGRAGVLAWVADNGLGFVMDAPSQGRGLPQMHQRATSLHGSLACRSHLGAGTRLELWLPVVR